jgi:hypothetical protein
MLAGLEMIGGADGLLSLLLQSHPDGTIRLFPGWPDKVPGDDVT